MKTIESHLSRNGISILACLPSGQSWRDNPEFLERATRSDVIVINGEGTLHHGRERGLDLLAILDAPGLEGIPVVLVNALYQENPPEWSPYIQRLSLVAARDSWSAKELKQSGASEARAMLDLSLCISADFRQGRFERAGIAIGDSIQGQTTAKFYNLLKQQPYFESVQILPNRKRAGGKSILGSRRLRAAYVKIHNKLLSVMEPPDAVTSLPQFVDRIARKEFYVTGRFHGVCLSIVAGTPFIAAPSNSWKIEALLHDIGLKKDRIVAPDAEPILRGIHEHRHFSSVEKACIEHALANVRADASQLFRDVAQLANGYRNRKIAA